MEEKIIVDWKEFIDALSLGLNDMEVSSSLGLDINHVQRLREHLEEVGGTIGGPNELETRRKIARKRLGLE